MDLQKGDILFYVSKDGTQFSTTHILARKEKEDGVYVRYRLLGHSTPEIVQSFDDRGSEKLWTPAISFSNEFKKIGYMEAGPSLD